MGRSTHQGRHGPADAQHRHRHAQHHSRRPQQGGDAADLAQRGRQVSGGQAQQDDPDGGRRAADRGGVDQHRRQLGVEPGCEEEPQQQAHQARGSQQQCGAKEQAGGQVRRGHDRDLREVSAPDEPG